MKLKLPLRAWAVLDGDELALVNGQVPVFWLRNVATQFNQERLNGTGVVVRVDVNAAPAAPRQRGK